MTPKKDLFKQYFNKNPKATFLDSGVICPGVNPGTDKNFVIKDDNAIVTDGTNILSKIPLGDISMGVDEVKTEDKVLNPGESVTLSLGQPIKQKMREVYTFNIENIPDMPGSDNVGQQVYDAFMDGSILWSLDVPRYTDEWFHKYYSENPNNYSNPIVENQDEPYYKLSTRYTRRMNFLGKGYDYMREEFVAFSHVCFGTHRFTPITLTYIENGEIKTADINRVITNLKCDNSKHNLVDKFNQAFKALELPIKCEYKIIDQEGWKFGSLNMSGLNFFNLDSTLGFSYPNISSNADNLFEDFSQLMSVDVYSLLKYNFPIEYMKTWWDIYQSFSYVGYESDPFPRLEQDAKGYELLLTDINPFYGMELPRLMTFYLENEYT